MLEPVQFRSRIILPIAWDLLDPAPSEAAQAALVTANTGVLGFLLRDVEAEATLRTPDERMAEALAPLHAKLDLVIELLGRLRYGDKELPLAQEIDFSLDRLAWWSSGKLEAGQWLRFRLYFHPTFLEPVLLHGQVVGSAPDEHDYRVEADLVAMPEATNEAVARLAFLTQRRQLAQHRSTAHPPHGAR